MNIGTSVRAHKVRYEPWFERADREMTAFFGLALVVIVLALVVGGASRENAVQLAIVEIAALFLLPLAALRAKRQGVKPGAILLLGAILALPVMQMIPLPPAVWTGLPGRELPASVYASAGLPLPWAPISMSPQHTLRSFLALIPAAAVFLATLTLSNTQRRRVILVVLAVTAAGLLLGAMQIAGGTESPAYIYGSTNRGSLVGFFANRNHQAALLLCALPLSAAVMARELQKRVPGRYDRHTITLTLCAGLYLSVFIALVVVKSRTGVLLAGPAVLASLAIIGLARGFAASKRALLALAGVVALAVLVIIPFGASRFLDRFGLDVAADLRFAVAPTIWQTALAHLPFGIGMGAFDSVYRSVEPLALLRPEFLNHAHNDYLEVWLEAGLVGAAILAAFLVWYGRAAIRAWRDRGRGAEITQAAAATVFVLMTFSTLDYPLRTLGLSCLFAFACGILATAPAPTKSSRRSRKT